MSGSYVIDHQQDGLHVCQCNGFQTRCVGVACLLILGYKHVTTARWLQCQTMRWPLHACPILHSQGPQERAPLLQLATGKWSPSMSPGTTLYCTMLHISTGQMRLMLHGEQSNTVVCRGRRHPSTCPRITSTRPSRHRIAV